MSNWFDLCPVGGPEPWDAASWPENSPAALAARTQQRETLRLLMSEMGVIDVRCLGQAGVSDCDNQHLRA